MVRNTDRLVTPAVVVTGLLVSGVIVLGVVAAVTFLTWSGRDPGPMLDLVAKIVTAVGSLGALVLQLANRAQVSRVERNTAPLAPGGVPLVLETPEPPTQQLWGRQSTAPPVPDAGRPRHRPGGS